MEREGRLYWGPDLSYKRPRLKRYLAEMKDGVVPSTWWPFQEVGHNDEGREGNSRVARPDGVQQSKACSSPAPHHRIGCSKNDIVLDFFAGSGITAHAVLDLNKQDGGNRKFILVQLPEPLNIDDKDHAVIL